MTSEYHDLTLSLVSSGDLAHENKIPKFYYYEMLTGKLTGSHVCRYGKSIHTDRDLLCFDLI